VLQVATEALLRTGQGSRWRKRLPPTWTLNMIGNIWLLWAFLFKSEAFPKSYEKVILSVRCEICIVAALSALIASDTALDALCSEGNVKVAT
jgi:hypothetical protein